MLIVGPTGARAVRGVAGALVNGTVGAVVAPRGQLVAALRFTVIAGKIVEIDVIADPARLRQLNLAVHAD